MSNDTSESKSVEHGGEPLIDVRGLHVEFGSNHVLRDINLAIPRGQTLAVIGESGCGKTVLTKTMIGLVRPTRGTVRFDGLSIPDLDERELTRQRLRFGYVFQQAALFDSMTVGQNIAFPLRLRGGFSRTDVEQNVRERLAEVGLPESVVYQRPAELSGGMRKRVGLARALAVDPEIMLYDEPTTGLDPIMTDVINELILRVRNRGGITGVVVTHDMKTARKVADRIVMVFPVSRLEPGEPQIIFDGPSDQLDQAKDRRVRQFVRGEAGERLLEMRNEGTESLSA